MATPVISRPKTVGSSPLPTIGDEKPDRGARLGQAAKSSTALKQATADQQDTSDSDDQDLETEKELEVQADKASGDDGPLESEKELEVQADTQDRSRPRPRPRPLPILVPRPQPPPAPGAAPNETKRVVPAKPRPASPTKHGTDNTESTGKDAEKQQRGADDAATTKPTDAGSETAAADAVADHKSCLPFRRNKKGPRKEACKGGKQKVKGALGKACEKLRMGLFSKKKKEPVVENPYANPVTPYEQARNDLHQQRVGGSPGGLPSNPRMNSFASSTAPPPYQSPASTYKSPSMASDSSRFGDDKFGNQNGYGSNRYDNNASAFNANQTRPGGYGGFGDDAGTNELFGGASSRYAAPQQGVNGSPSLISPKNGASPFQSPASQYDDPSKGALLGSARDRYDPLPPTSRQAAPEDDEYGGYGAPRELTEEERDREEARNINAEARQVRKEGLASLARSKALGYAALDQAAATAARLGEQDARLANAERNLDAAKVMARNAEESTKTLDKINGSMWGGLIGPSKRQISESDARKLAQYQKEKEEAEKTQQDAYRSQRQAEDTFNRISDNKPKLLGANRNTAEKSKFLYEDDTDDEDEKALRNEDANDEEQIDNDLDELGDLVGRLKGAAMGQGQMLETQNARLDRLKDKTDLVDDRVRMNREKLSRIR